MQLVIDEFAKKYAKPHGSAWVKRNILYPAAIWMNEHRKEIDWDAK